MDMRLVELDVITNSSSFQPDAINVSQRVSSEVTHFTTIMLMEVYCLPVICIFGLVGNTLSAITFFKKSLRRTSCSIYLAVRSISDNGFLLALTLIWISIVFHLELSRIQVVCQTIILLTYISGCVSVWLVVFVTVDNYIRICHPFVVATISSKQIARIITLSLCICAFGVYSLPLWISNTDCTHNEKYCDITQALVYTDTLLTLVIPTLLIIGFMTAIVSYLIRSRCVRGSPDIRPNRKYLPATKITKMLFIVSVMFFLLTFPSHIIRLYILINSFIKGQSQVPSPQGTIQTIFQLIYYLSFAVNIIAYIVFGKNFRATFKKTFCCKQILNHMERRSTEAINTVPKEQRQGQFSLTVIIGSNKGHYVSIPSFSQQHTSTT